MPCTFLNRSLDNTHVKTGYARRATTKTNKINTNTRNALITVVLRHKNEHDIRFETIQNKRKERHWFYAMNSVAKNQKRLNDWVFKASERTTNNNNKRTTLDNYKKKKERNTRNPLITWFFLRIWKKEVVGFVLNNYINKRTNDSGFQTWNPLQTKLATLQWLGF